jgi:hypothetical protein
MKITSDQARRLGKRYNINFDVVPVKDLQYGMNVELEHGTRNGITNVTNNNLEMTFKIALAHLLEFPDYYSRLRKMEESADAYWSRREKPDVFLTDPLNNDPG